MVKRYMLFAGEYYYAAGGSHDYTGSYDVLEDAVAAGKNFIEKDTYTWFNIFDTQEDETVDLYDIDGYGGGHC